MFYVTFCVHVLKKNKTFSTWQNVLFFKYFPYKLYRPVGCWDIVPGKDTAFFYSLSALFIPILYRRVPVLVAPFLGGYIIYVDNAINSILAALSACSSYSACLSLLIVSPLSQCKKACAISCARL